MEGPMSPILAEIFMEHLEENVFYIVNSDHAPLFFKRYVKDTLAAVPTGKEDDLMDLLNAQFPEQISFGIKKKKLNTPLPGHLDDQISRREKTSVHRKPTHSDRYLNLQSQDTWSTMIGIMKGLVDCGMAICDIEFIDQELNHIQKSE
ncbi:hypothetical protein M514_02362 [Trichuris suis]|uniref:Reverse transcriptase domain-containing protein n=1 Tax=Trichuris suis TaxID=68888 RepID=A0A085NBN7_9BILA|nr:hypothetical protein M513_02362 [Trichuris suis]KFD66883.1 hypothetical protein M514_02362 [Trichuris suis]